MNNDQEQKERAAKKLFSRLQSRERLRLLAGNVQPKTPEERELDRLKHEYLPVWAELARGSAVGHGLPGEAPMVDLMRPTASWDLGESVDTPDPWVCNVIDASINEISVAVSLARAALTVRYLNAKGPSVYRSGRLTELSRDEVEGVADEAERRLLPVVKRRGLLL